MWFPLSICLLLVEYTWLIAPQEYFCEGSVKDCSPCCDSFQWREGTIPCFCVFTGTSCLGSMASGAWSPQMNLQRMWLELKPYWKGTRYVKDKCIININKWGFFSDTFQLEFQIHQFRLWLLSSTSLPLAGAPHRNRCKSWHFPGIWTVWTTASCPWTLCQPWDQGETGYSGPRTDRPGEGLGPAQNDAGPVPGTTGTLLLFG